MYTYNKLYVHLYTSYNASYIIIILMCSFILDNYHTQFLHVLLCFTVTATYVHRHKLQLVVHCIGTPVQLYNYVLANYFFNGVTSKLQIIVINHHLQPLHESNKRITCGTLS